MSAFHVAWNAVVPIFLVMGSGYAAKKLGMFGDEFVNQASRFVFKVSLPALVFSKVASINLAASFDGSQIYLMVFCAVTFVAGYIITRLACRFVIKDAFNERGYVTGAFIQGSVRSNYIIIGYPVLLNLFGDAIIVNMALVTLVFIPLINILAIIALTPPNQHTGFKKYRELIKNILTNPMIIAICFGFLSAALGFNLDTDYPLFLSSFIRMNANLATPLALVAIGAFFRFDGLRETLNLTVTAAFIKLFALPVIMTALAFLSGFEPMNIILISVLFGGPAAVSSFTLSNELGGDPVLAGNIIILSSALSVISLIAMITFWLSFFGLTG